MPTNISVTPQPNRHTRAADPDGSALLRRSFENELWDDLANVVFKLVSVAGGTVCPAGANTTVLSALNIPCPVPTRVQFDIVVNLDSAATTSVGVEVWEGAVQLASTGPLPIGVAQQSWVFFPVLDLVAGNHLVRVTVNNIGANPATFERGDTAVRRGRKPSA